MRPELSLPCLQAPASGPYPEPDEYNLQQHYFTKISFNIIQPPLRMSSEWFLLFRV
jgi:hypothetical protein